MMVGKQAGVEEALEGSSQWSEPRCLGLKTRVGRMLPLPSAWSSRGLQRRGAVVEDMDTSPGQADPVPLPA